MRLLIQRFLAFLRTTLISIQLPAVKQPSVAQTFWVGASYGVLGLAFVVAISASLHFSYGTSRWLIVLMGVVGSIVCLFFFGLVTRWLGVIIAFFPHYFAAAVGGSIGLLMVVRGISFGFPGPYFFGGGFLLMISVSGLFGAIFVLVRGSHKAFGSQARRLMMLLFLISAGAIGFILYWLNAEGSDPYTVDFQQRPIDSPLSGQLDNPARMGPFAVRQFSYGSGENAQRPEFGQEADFLSQSVDGTYVLPSWKGQAKKRSAYWGFDLDSWPINGLVWMPEGDGPFPVVLIVHGNHGMEEYSDPGYAYLGELLASRGYLCVSVDENFINGSFAGDFRGKELPARAWLLLKHLEQWRSWNEQPGHALQGKADLSNVVLIGHSRGGEAVPIAAAFNALSYFPDDSRVSFDFGFGIKGVVAIAPTDYRYDRRVHLENINYLGIQGSYDSDEDSFYGLRQLQRTHFEDSTYHVRAGVLLHGANHGQFNTIWGRHDAGFPRNLLLNTEPMISGEDQQAYAQVLISAFLDITLQGHVQYAPLFEDLRHGIEWLPQGLLALSVYEDQSVQYWADYEEDLDLITAAAGTIRSRGMEVWMEDYLQYRAGLHQENTTVILGWSKDSLTAEHVYEIALSDTLAVDRGSSFTLSVAPGDPSLLNDVDEEELINDFTVVLTDKHGAELRKKWSDHIRIPPRLKIRFLKSRKLTTDRYRNEWEPFLQTMTLPFAAFDGVEAFDFESIVAVRFEFPRESSGIVMLDRIGTID